MIREELTTIVNEIVDKGIKAIKKHTDRSFPLDYVAVFSKSKEEQKELLVLVQELGRVVEKTRTGLTFLLKDPIKTRGGELGLLKIRTPDNTRLQRGAPDFKVDNYENFKQKYLNEDEFRLIKRPGFEMIELKDDEIGILVYFPNETLSESLSTEWV